MSVDWFSPQEIKYMPEQVLWLIPLLPLLRTGGYPPDPKYSGYSKTPARTPSFKGAYFETPVALAADLDSRLERAGLDGLILEFIYSAESEDKLSLKRHIAIALRTTVENIDWRCRRALMYISGWRRKTYPYSDFVSHRRQRKGTGGR